MSGGSPAHAGITAKVIELLGRALAGRPCRAFSSELRIRATRTGLATYPDVSVVCGKLELDPEERRQHTATNPTLVLEVPSPTTEAYDRGEKLAHYQQTIESLAETDEILTSTCLVGRRGSAASGLPGQIEAERRAGSGLRR